MPRTSKNYTGHQRHIVESGVQRLVGTRLPAPSGDISGHTAGSAYEDLAYENLKILLGERVMRQHELLNATLAENQLVYGQEARERLLGPHGQSRLLRRGASAMEEWDIDNQFSYKQNDTADCVVLPVKAPLSCPVDNDRLLLVDVKSHNASRASQAPNIISSKKLYEAGLLAVQDSRSSAMQDLSFDMLYIFFSWDMAGKYMVCSKVETLSLFKTDPASLRINWTAGGQIQFHPCDVSQDWEGSSVDWMTSYMRHRNASKRRHAEKLQEECSRDDLELCKALGLDEG